jgi:hypothetical protein
MSVRLLEGGMIFPKRCCILMKPKSFALNTARLLFQRVKLSFQQKEKKDIE